MNIQYDFRSREAWQPGGKDEKIGNRVDMDPVSYTHLDVYKRQILSHDRVGCYLSTADVCVAPDPQNSLNDKCTMIKNLEYMAFGKPVVSYDLTEGRLALGNGALYARPNDPVDFANKIETLLESESLRNTLGASGRKRVEEELNWTVQSGRLIGALSRLLNSQADCVLAHPEMER